MRLDPNTTIENLLRAIPSSSVVFEKLRIRVSGSEKRALQDACAEQGVDLSQFLRELDEINWDKEPSEREAQQAS